MKFKQNRRDSKEIQKMKNIYRQTIIFRFFFFALLIKVYLINGNFYFSNQMPIFRSNSPYEAFSDSENDLTSTKNRRNNESTEKCLSTDSLPVKSKRANLLELKERLSTPNKEQTKNSEQNDNSGEKKCARVVKNLNEFLNFTSLNRSKITPSDAEPELR